MRWFRPGPSPHRTALAMVGAKAGQAALVIGAGDGQLAAELALVTGLNGRTLVVDRADGAQARVIAAAARAGSLVDYEDAPAVGLPLDPDTFDVVVLNRVLGAAATARTTMVAEAARVAREGGRIVVIESAGRPGLFGALARSKAADPMRPGAIRDLLAAAGLRATRLLAEADGVAYVEGVKPRP